MYGDAWTWELVRDRLVELYKACPEIAVRCGHGRRWELVVDEAPIDGVRLRTAAFLVHEDETERAVRLLMWARSLAMGGTTDEFCRIMPRCSEYKLKRDAKAVADWINARSVGIPSYVLTSLPELVS